MQLITAIKINVVLQTLELVKLEPSHEGLQTALECVNPELVRYAVCPTGRKPDEPLFTVPNCLIADRNGVSSKIGGLFYYDGYIFVGHGLIIGYDVERNSRYVSTLLTPDDITRRVRFETTASLLQRAKENKI